MSDVSLIFSLLAVDKLSNVIGNIKKNFGAFALEGAAGAVALGAKLVEMGGDFEFSMTRLVTGAGESQKNLKLVSSGVLDMAGKVGESTKDLASGMYLVESAGFHGADGLKVLQVAAMGAKVGNADLATVSDAVTTALNAYHMGADQAAAATNALVAAEGQGKTNLEALSGSLSTVAPIAAVAHVRLNEVLAAMATMTGQGTDAASAATYLKQTIGQLSNPTAKASSEMKALGLSAVQVGQNLSKNGLASTLQMITDAIQKKMGPAGTVLIDKLQKSAKSTSDFQKVLANLPPTQQTYIGAMATMVGGTKSMQAALELTGGNMQTFVHNTEVIDEKVKSGGNSIEGWALVQKTFNQRMSEAKETVNALGVRIGVGLLPAAEKMLTMMMAVVQWGERNKSTLKTVAVVVGLLAAAFVVYKVAVFALEAPTKAAAAAQWLLNAAMELNPIGLIIVAIVALVAGFAYLWTHSAAFRNFWIGLWNSIWGFMKAVGAWFAGPFKNFFVSLWHGIVSVWNSVLGFFKGIGAWFAGPFAHFFVSAAHAVAAPFVWLWHNVLSPMFQFWMAGMRLTMSIAASFGHLWMDLAGIFFRVVWGQFIKPVITGMGVLFDWLFNNVIHPAITSAVFWFHVISEAISIWWHVVVEPAIHAVAGLFTWLWQSGIMPMVHGLESIFHAVEVSINFWWHAAIEPAIHGVVSAFEWLRGVANSIFSAVIGAVEGVGHAFSNVFHAIAGYVSSGFSSAVGIVKGAINYLIGMVNNGIGAINGMIGAANKLPGVNFPKIPSIPYLATGGLVTGSGLAMVGERGAEVVSLPSGSQVYPHGSGPRGGTQETIYLRPGNELGDMLIKILRTAIGARGGNPVIVLKPA